MPLYREDLESLKACGLQGCTHHSDAEEIYLHGQCHPDAPCWVHYHADVLTVICARCRRKIMSVVVATRVSDERGLDPPDEQAVP